MTQQKTAVGKTIRTNHDKENPYFMVARATAQDKCISYEALGVLTYLLSQSDQWEVRVTELAQRGKGEKKQGLTRIYRILKELRAAGYVVLEAEYVKGRIVNWTYQVHERPILLNQNLQVENLRVENDSPNKDKEVPESTKETSLDALTDYEREEQKSISVANNATGSAANNPPLPQPDKPKSGKAPDPWYDNILAVWKLHAGGNTDMRKFLQGNATKKGWKEYNPPPGYTLTDAVEVCHFARWYRNTYQGGKRDLSMVAERGKLQSAIIEWVDAGRPTGDTQQYRNERLFI